MHTCLRDEVPSLCILGKRVLFLAKFMQPVNFFFGTFFFFHEKKKATGGAGGKAPEKKHPPYQICHIPTHNLPNCQLPPQRNTPLGKTMAHPLLYTSQIFESM